MALGNNKNAKVCFGKSPKENKLAPKMKGSQKPYGLAKLVKATK